MANISIHGSHNASITIENKGEILEVIEAERYLNSKNIGLTQYMTAFSRHFAIPHILEYIKNKYNIKKFEKCFYSNTDVIEGPNKIHTEKYIPAKEYINCLHHEMHAAGSFYQSNDSEALIISFDGGGSDGFFNIYYATREKGVELLEKFNNDLGFSYMIFGEFLSDIKKEIDIVRGNLVYSGKLMGLSSYGKVKEHWVKPFKHYYSQNVNGVNYLEHLKVLGKKIGVEFNKNNQIEGQLAWDIAATSQKIFEEKFIEISKPYLKLYSNSPLHLSGGCALNILLNTRIKKEFNNKLFVSPNPNDCGLSVGMILNYLKPTKAIDITYKGIEILDKNILMEYVEEYSCPKLDQKRLVKDLIKGNIIGVVRDSSEHGPRALGNRSIICNPMFPDMKDILNSKVKNREWYRPFAPVVRLEDVNEYFEFKDESRWMSFCPKVKKEWREKLPSITHVDNTARIQTVTKDQNPWLYQLLTDFKKDSGIGVLLNTSFNLAGKPIVSTYKDAMHLYKVSQMDRLILQDFYFTWKNLN